MKNFFVLLVIIILIFASVYFFLRNKTKPWTPEWEENIETFQPTSKIMDIIGIERGMNVGEIGAGNGRFAVRLAKRIGPEGQVYANDIDLKAVRFMKQRIKSEKIENMHVILSQITNPYFPRNKLDLVCVINSYEKFSDPVRLLTNTLSSLKDSGMLAIVAIDPLKSENNKKMAKSKDKVVEQVTNAGFELQKIDSTSLDFDNVYVFRKKD